MCITVQCCERAIAFCKFLYDYFVMKFPLQTCVSRVGCSDVLCFQVANIVKIR